MQVMRMLTKLAAAAALTVVGVGPALAQSAPQPATIGGKPNLNGIWQAVNTAFWDLEPHSAETAPVGERILGAIGAIPAGVGVVEGGEIPYLPAAKAQRDENRKNRIKSDPEGACYLPGIPRATYMNYPFQIVQGDNDDILVAYEYASANRVIYMRETEIPPIDTWMGTSYGKWEGNTLVVTTLAQNGQTWMDRAGNYLTSTSSVVEKFTPRGPNHIDYEATISDPALYSKEWKIKMPLYRRVEANAQLLEFKCVPFSEMFLYGDLLEVGNEPVNEPAAEGEQ
jgi:hypothetical protein